MAAAVPPDRTEGSRIATSIVLVGIWFAILTGFTEVLILGIRKLVMHELVFQSPDTVWMSPLGALGLFCVPAASLAAVAVLGPRLLTLGRASGVFAFLGCLSVLLMFDPRLSRYASMLLAFGIATTLARIIDAHPRGFDILLRRSMAWVPFPPRTTQPREVAPAPNGMDVLVDRRRFLVTAAGTMAIAAVGVKAWESAGEWRAAAARGPATPGAPNVLLVVLDTVRAQSASFDASASQTTPRLAQLARTGVRFGRAHAPAPWTLPSHASMFTGRHPHELSADWLTPLDSTYPTLAEVLRDHGYATAGFASNTDYVSRESGLSRGFEHFEDYGVSVGETVLSSSIDAFLANSNQARRLTGFHDILGRKRAADVNAAFMSWLGRIDRAPFFAFLNYFDAHEPYFPPPPFDSQFGDPRARDLTGYQSVKHGAGRLDYTSLSPEQVKAEIGAYEGSIAYVDAQLGSLLDQLQSRDVLDNTLVIVTADHGEEFGEHGIFTHGNSLYLPSLWVPLVIRLPGRVPASAHRNDSIGLREIPRTVVDLLGIKNSAPFPGRSLARFWQSSSVSASALDEEPVLSEVSAGIRKDPSLPVAKGPMSSVLSNDYHYIRNGDGREELYHIGRDPWEQQDLSGSQRDRTALEQLRTSLQAMLPSRSAAQA